MSDSNRKGKGTNTDDNIFIMYRSQNDDLVITDTDYLDSKGDQDPILELAVELMVAGYPGIVVHTKPLSNGRYFFGTNYRADTPEGRIYARAQADFHRSRKIPDIPALVRQIEAEYDQLGGFQNDD